MWRKVYEWNMSLVTNWYRIELFRFDSRLLPFQRKSLKSEGRGMFFAHYLDTAFRDEKKLTDKM